MTVLLECYWCEHIIAWDRLVGHCRDWLGLCSMNTHLHTTAVDIYASILNSWPKIASTAHAFKFCLKSVCFLFMECYFILIVHVIRNKTGPLSTDNSVAELKAALTGPVVHQHRERKANNHNFWPLEERLSNMEEYLQIHNKSE